MSEEKGEWSRGEKWENEAKFIGKTSPCLEFTCKRIYANGFKFCLCWIKKNSDENFIKLSYLQAKKKTKTPPEITK